MHYINSHSCLVPISEIKVLLTAILVWLIRIYPWTALEVFCKQEEINNTVLKILIDMSTLLNVRTPSLSSWRMLLFLVLTITNFWGDPHLT